MDNPIAVSTWSLHRSMGYAYENGPGAVEPFAKAHPWGTGGIDLLDVPQALAREGYRRCEICHFHVASLAPPYLARVAEAFASADVVIQTLLIDDGDISNPDADSRARDIAWVTSWLAAAAEMKAENARIIAGKQKPSPQALSLSAEALREFVAFGKSRGVNVVTENWLDLTPSPHEVHYLLDHAPGLGFLADTGNWRGETKFTDLQSIFARASLCHAKARVGPGHEVDGDDFGECLRAAEAAAYKGPMTLIFDDEGDEWMGLAAEREFVREHVA
jgi:sugar phosphate isomerase/epimerase